MYNEALHTQNVNMTTIILKILYETFSFLCSVVEIAQSYITV